MLKLIHLKHLGDGNYYYYRGLTGGFVEILKSKPQPFKKSLISLKCSDYLIQLLISPFSYISSKLLSPHIGKPFTLSSFQKQFYGNNQKWS